MTRFDFELARSKRHMRRFFFLELPGAALLVAASFYVLRSLPESSPKAALVLATVAYIISVFASGCLWFTRLPPHRPAPYDLDTPYEPVTE